MSVFMGLKAALLPENCQGLSAVFDLLQRVFAPVVRCSPLIFARESCTEISVECFSETEKTETVVNRDWRGKQLSGQT
jgi:hypothetical protein